MLSTRNLTSEIPNIVGKCTIINSGGGTGPFTDVTTKGWAGSSERQNKHGFTFNASRCSDRYGNYTEVNPLYESTLICIRY